MYKAINHREFLSLVIRLIRGREKRGSGKRGTRYWQIAMVGKG